MQISCVFAQEKSSAFFDNQLSQAETELLLNHIESCESCAQIFAQLEKIDISPPKLNLATQRLFDEPQYWEEMDAHINQAFEEQKIQEKWAPKRWDRKHFVLVALLLFSVGWGWYQNSQRSGLQLVVESQQQQLDRMHQRFVNVPTESIPAQSKPKQSPVRFDL